MNVDSVSSLQCGVCALSVLVQITAKRNAVTSWESRCKMAQLITALSSNGYKMTSDCLPSEF